MTEHKRAAAGLPLHPGEDQVPGQTEALVAVVFCRHTDGREHPAGLDGGGFPITCDQHRATARLHWVVDLAPDQLT